MRTRFAALVGAGLLMGALALPVGAAGTVTCTATATNGSGGSYTREVSPGVAKQIDGMTVVYNGIAYVITCGR
jgi:hypothetical protein